MCHCTLPRAKNLQATRSPGLERLYGASTLTHQTQHELMRLPHSTVPAVPGLRTFPLTFAIARMLLQVLCPKVDGLLQAGQSILSLRGGHCSCCMDSLAFSPPKVSVISHAPFLPHHVLLDKPRVIQSLPRLHGAGIKTQLINACNSCCPANAPKCVLSLGGKKLRESLSSSPCRMCPVSGNLSPCSLSKHT